MLITLNEAKAHLAITDSDDDAQITAFLESLTRAFEDFCGRRLEAAEVTDYLDSAGTEKLFFSQPAEDVTAVYVDANRVWIAADLIDASEYLLRSGPLGTGRCIERLTGCWPAGRCVVKAVYQAGYTAMPAAIADAARIQVGRMVSEWKRAIEGLDGMEKQSVEGWSQTWLAKAGIDTAAADLLAPYVNVGL
jgi:Phage gp6-like head-tail connector protein